MTNDQLGELIAGLNAKLENQDSARSEKESQLSAKEMIHWVIQAAYALVLVCGGFITNMMWESIKDNTDKIDVVPKEYVSRIEYREDQTKIENGMATILQKIDHNAEYMEADYNRRMDKLETMLTDFLRKQSEINKQ